MSGIMSEVREEKLQYSQEVSQLFMTDTVLEKKFDEFEGVNR